MRWIGAALLAVTLGTVLGAEDTQPLEPPCEDGATCGSPEGLALLALKSHVKQTMELTVKHSLEAPIEETRATTAPAGRRSKYGFYMHVFNSPAAVIHQLRGIKKYFPKSPVYVMSDGGMDFTEMCRVMGCMFQLCPPANDRWHPWPFFRRMYDAAVALNVEFVIMLEPDNTIHGPIKREPKADAGGLYVSQRGFGLTDYVERLAHRRKPGFKWTKIAMQAGLAGGSYYRREAILDAFSDEHVAEIDWNYVAEASTKEVYSSDFAMQYALAARGWRVEPWEDCAQMDRNKDQPLTGPKDAAFRHYSGSYPGGKPTYNLPLQRKDQGLVREAPENYRRLNSVCQLCYNLSQYVKLWGTTKCTNHIPFLYSKTLLHRYHEETLERGCDLPWLCASKER